MTAWQDSWTFRIVDQDTGAAVPGVPVSVLESGGRAGGYWVSDGDGLVRIPKHDQPRLRLRVGLRNEEAIEFDARSLPDDAIPLTAPRDIALPGTAAPSAPPAVAPAAAQTQTGHLMRFARIGVLPQDRDITAGSEEKHSAAPLPDPTSMRYGVLLEIELIWQSLGAQAGDTLYSISLGPGEEVKLAVSDGRWRKSSDARERPLQIVAKMVGARQIGDGMDAVPLGPCVAPDLASAAADTVTLLAERTARTCEALRRRALGVTELDGEKPTGGGTSVRTHRCPSSLLLGHDHRRRRPGGTVLCTGQAAGSTGSPPDRRDREHRGGPRGPLRRLSAPLHRVHDAGVAQRAGLERGAGGPRVAGVQRHPAGPGRVAALGAVPGPSRYRECRGRRGRRRREVGVGDRTYGTAETTLAQVHISRSFAATLRPVVEVGEGWWRLSRFPAV